MGVPTLLVAGTASHVGKTTVAAGLCRVFAEQDLDVAPFKAQNMSNNARAVPKATDITQFGEIGISQYMQAMAAEHQPTTDSNPVLLKPRGDQESQIIINGDPIGYAGANEYYEHAWDQAREHAQQAWERLAAENDLIVAEGAGSIAEINLHDRDLANIETADFTDAAILLVADIERGGVFASIIGTLELLPDRIADRIVGIVISKFRGDQSLLADGIETVETTTGVPVLGVLPYVDLGLPEEDSLALPDMTTAETVGAEDGIGPDQSVKIIVPRLPHISNVPDIDPLVRQPGVRVTYQPPDRPLNDADAVLIPGTKNTVDDLQALTAAGFDDRLKTFGGPIVGLCGGYQMLGERVRNAAIEGTGTPDTVEGLGLLPVETTFYEDKQITQRQVYLTGAGPLKGIEGTVEGYEIHAGQTTQTGTVNRPFAPSATASGTVELGAAVGNVIGTYLHGLFENKGVREGFLTRLYDQVDQQRPAVEERSDPFEQVGNLITNHVDMAPIEAALELDQ